MDAQGEKVIAITAAVDETALAADAAAGSIAVLREDTARVAGDIASVGTGVIALEIRWQISKRALQTLQPASRREDA